MKRDYYNCCSGMHILTKIESNSRRAKIKHFSPLWSMLSTHGRDLLCFELFSLAVNKFDLSRRRMPFGHAGALQKLSSI